MEETKMKTLGFKAIPMIGIAAILTAFFPMNAANIRVPRDYLTIQQAVDAARPGDRIVMEFTLHWGSAVIDGLSDIEIRGTSAALNPAPGHTEIGIHIKNSTNITLNGFEVRDFERAIVIENSSFCTVNRMKIHDNRDNGASAAFMADGIVLINSHGIDLTSNEVFQNGNNGILVTAGSTGNTLRGNRVYGNGWQMDGSPDIGAGAGIALNGGTQQDNMLNGNKLGGNRWGILLGPDGSASDNQITRNTTTGNARAGIALLENAENNLVKANTATGNNTMQLDPSTPYDIYIDTTGAENIVERNKGLIGP
jgi:parallel beta-helix repeat protein